MTAGVSPTTRTMSGARRPPGETGTLPEVCGPAQRTGEEHRESLVVLGLRVPGVVT